MSDRDCPSPPLRACGGGRGNPYPIYTLNFRYSQTRSSRRSLQSGLALEEKQFPGASSAASLSLYA